MKRTRSQHRIAVVNGSIIALWRWRCRGRRRLVVQAAMV